MKSKIINSILILIFVSTVILMFFFVKDQIRKDSNIKSQIEELEFQKFQRDSIILAQNKLIKIKSKEKDSIVKCNSEKICILSKAIIEYKNKIGAIKNLTEPQCKDSVMNALSCYNDSLFYCMAYESVLNLGKCKIENDTLNYTIKSKNAEISFNEFEIEALKIDTTMLRLNIIDEKAKGELIKKDADKQNKELKKKLFWTRVGAATITVSSMLLLIVSL